MDLLDKASQELGVKSDTLNLFSVNDFYNDNVLDGFICRQNDYRYGTLVITHVNKESVPQIIYGAPKILYPFTSDEQTGERKYNWPKAIEEARVYEKYDGTNIIIYSYADANGKRFVTFKTRLTPIVRAGDSIDFAALWDIVLEQYPELRCPPEVLNGEYAWSFELYGYRNPVVMKYEVPIDAVFIFKVKQQEHQVEPPSKLIPAKRIAQGGIDNKIIYKANDQTMLTTIYNEMREKAEREHKQVEEGIEGVEGFVFYIRENDIWQMYKCKPADIEKIHWASSSIDKHSILVTAKNALENVSANKLTVEVVEELLKEEFTEQQISKSRVRIKNIVVIVIEQAWFLAKVKEEYNRLSPEVKAGGKVIIMRAMAATNLFAKKDMKKVYWALKELGALL